MIMQRDLLLVPFPFSDQKGKKVRPVIVISNNLFNETSEDILVVGVTSNISKDFYSVILRNKDLEEGKLFTSCSVKAENILKIDKGVVLKKIGRISKEKFGNIKRVIFSLIE